MEVEVAAASLEEKYALINLVKMYCYEWSQYNKRGVDANGEYAFERHIPKFWEKPRYYPYFIRVDGELAGFALVDDDFDLYPSYDHAMSEFFVMHKFRRAGAGRRAARAVFDLLPGSWEIKMHPANTASIVFWRSVVGEYANGEYAEVIACPSAAYADGSLGNIISFTARAASRTAEPPSPR